MMKARCLTSLTVCLVLLGLLAGCSRELPVEVFVPPQGDAVRGKDVFVKFSCYSCHTIPDVDLPERAAEPPFVLALGVQMHRVRDYGDLMTAVLYPDHVVSPKFVAALKAAGKEAELLEMPDFTGEMTVAELIDLVEFLHAQYSRLLSREYQGKGSPPRSRLNRVGDD
jgi:hypothetical protein